MPEHQIKLDSETDKMEVLTHVVAKHLAENGGELQLQQARNQALETIQDVDESTKQDLSEQEFNRLVKEKPAFKTGKDQFDQTVIQDVQKIGGHHEWLEMPEMGGEADTQDKAEKFNISNLGNNGGFTQGDDLSQLDALSQHQPDALREEGFESFRDLHEASVDELTAAPGVGEVVANEIKSEVTEFIDPVEDIAQEAYEAETSDTDGANGEDTDDIHLITDVKIPAGEPRGPEYEGTNEPRHINGLPILEYPTLSVDMLQRLVNDDDVESTEDLLDTLKPLVAYDEQFDNLQDAVSAYDIDEVTTAVYANNESVLDEIEYQAGCDEQQLIEAVSTQDSLVADAGLKTDVVLDIDLALENEVPVKSRLAIMSEMQAIHAEESKDSYTRDADVDALDDDECVLTDAVVERLAEASEAPVQLDHPFIDDVDEYPTLKTRELENGELDVEAAARVIAKNNYTLDLIGHAGVGKDTLIKVLAAATNRPLITINMDGSMISQELLGIHQIDEEGKVIFKDGVLPHTAKYGYMLMISEVNAAPPDIQTAFHQVMERNAELHLKERDEIIIPSPKFRAVTTRNPPTEEYAGAKEMNGAFERRLNSIEIPYLEREQEIDLIDTMVNGDRQVIAREDIETLVDMANKFREAAEQGGARTVPRLSTSKIMHIIDLYDGSDDLLGTAKMSVKAELGRNHTVEDCMNKIEDAFNA